MTTKNSTLLVKRRRQKQKSSEDVSSDQQIREASYDQDEESGEDEANESGEDEANESGEDEINESGENNDDITSEDLKLEYNGIKVGDLDEDEDQINWFKNKTLEKFRKTLPQKNDDTDDKDLYFAAQIPIYESEWKMLNSTGRQGRNPESSTRKFVRNRLRDIKKCKETIDKLKAERGGSKSTKKRDKKEESKSNVKKVNKKEKQITAIVARINVRLENDHLRDTVFMKNVEIINRIDDALKYSTKAVIATLREGINQMEQKIVSKNEQVEKKLDQEINQMKTKVQDNEIQNNIQELQSYKDKLVKDRKEFYKEIDDFKSAEVNNENIKKRYKMLAYHVFMVQHKDTFQQ